MRRSTSLLALPAAAALAMLAPASAFAAESYQVSLDPLNHTKSMAMATVTMQDDGDLKVHIEAHGLTPNAPHAQHIHGDATGAMDFHCPTMAADANHDGVLTTAEGLKMYGGIFISLTTKGDTSPTSALAVDRMPVADGSGNVTYDRTIPASQLPKGTKAALKNLHLVQHGVDFNNNGKYDFGKGKSELDPKLPQEATAPADCGMIEGSAISSMPHGGVETGTATGQGVEALPMVAVGGALLVGSGALLVTRRRRASAER